MKIGELSKYTGVSRDAIRLYEKKGILINISQPFPWNNYKDYGVENVERIKKLKKLQHYSFTLNEIKTFFDPVSGDKMECNTKKKIFYNKLSSLDSEIEKLQHTKDILSTIMIEHGLL